MKGHAVGENQLKVSTSALEAQKADFFAFLHKYESAFNPTYLIKAQIELAYRYPGSDSFEEKKLRELITDIIAMDIFIEEITLLRQLAEKVKKLKLDYESQLDDELQKIQKEEFLKQFLELRDQSILQGQLLLEKLAMMLNKIELLITELTKQLDQINTQLKAAKKSFNKDFENILNELFGHYSRNDETRVIVIDKNRIEIHFSEIIARINLLKQLRGGEIAPDGFKAIMRSAIYECIQERCQERGVTIRDDRRDEVEIIVGLVGKSIQTEMQKNKHHASFKKHAAISIELEKQRQYTRACIETLESQHSQIQAMIAEQRQLITNSRSVQPRDLQTLQKCLDNTEVGHQLQGRCDKLLTHIENRAKQLDLTAIQNLEVTNEIVANPQLVEAPKNEVVHERRRSIWRR